LAAPALRVFGWERRFEVDVEPGIALGALRVIGRGFSTSYSSARFEIGVRMAVEAALHLPSAHAGFAPVVGVEITYLPETYALDVISRGIVAQTPNTWVGVTAGVRWGVE
jgi:hypothetical protein